MNKFSITNYELRVKKRMQDTICKSKCKYQNANRNNNRNNKYDPEDRITEFAKRVIKLLKCLPKIP
jgi:hypothetical protein